MSQSDSNDGNSFDGRIWVRDQDREWVNDHKQGGETQADVLERLIAFYEEHDPDAVDTAEPDVDALADALAARLDTGDGADTASIAKETADEVERRLR